ncbi:MAG: DUF2489 domain-containing protein [Halopseudomonas sp.]
MTTFSWLALAGLIIIIALAIYAFVLWKKVLARKAQQRAIATERNQRLASDIIILAKSLLEGQLPVIEGSIRIKVLLDNYYGPRRADLDVSVFERIYDATAHIPTHQGWQDLPKAERQLHERQMEVLERDHHEAITLAAKNISRGLGN